MKIFFSNFLIQFAVDCRPSLKITWRGLKFPLRSKIICRWVRTKPQCKSSKHSDQARRNFGSLLNLISIFYKKKKTNKKTFLSFRSQAQLHKCTDRRGARETLLKNYREIVAKVSDRDKVKNKSKWRKISLKYTNVELFNEFSTFHFCKMDDEQNDLTHSHTHTHFLKTIYRI